MSLKKSLALAAGVVFMGAVGVNDRGFLLFSQHGGFHLSFIIPAGLRLGPVKVRETKSWAAALHAKKLYHKVFQM